jgi:hypothetical protein
MGTRATAGTRLVTLVKTAVPLLKAAEHQCPRTGPGDKPKIPDWVMAALIMIGILKRKKSKSAQYRFLCEQRREIADWLRDGRFPSRATYFRRYRRAHELYRAAIRLQGQKAVAEGVTDPKDVAVDKSLVAAQGPPWHQRDRRKGKTPTGVDREGTWGYSEYHGWVYGYSFEVVVSSNPNTTVFPLLASVDTASAAEMRTFAEKIEELPQGTRHVSADAGYDANLLGEQIEYDEKDRRTGRRYLCPQNPRNNARPKTKPGGADASRARSRQRRGERKKFLKSARGQRLFRRRSKTVEPFNSWLKSLFELETRVWHRGLANNQTQVLTAIFTYQLLVRYNHRCGRRNGRLRWIMDAL